MAPHSKPQTKNTVVKVAPGDLIPRKHRLLGFLNTLLSDSAHSDLIIWSNRDKWEFKMVQPHQVAKLYGAYIGSAKTYLDGMCRGLRLFSKEGLVEKVKGAMYSWRFLKPQELPSIDQVGVSATFNSIQLPATTPSDAKAVKESVKLALTEKDMEAQKKLDEFHKFLQIINAESTGFLHWEIFSELSNIFPNLVKD